MTALPVPWQPWVDGWKVPMVAALQILTVAGLFLLARLAASGGIDAEQPIFIERITVIAIWLPLMLGFQLKTVLGCECLALSHAHAVQQLRRYFLVILPAAAGLVAIPLLLLGKPLVASLTAAAGPTLLGAWIGYNLSSLLPAAAALAYLLSLGAIEWLPAEARPAAWSAYLLLFLAGGLIAWRNLLRHPWRAPPAPGPVMQRIQAWFDRLGTGTGSIAPSIPGRLPELTDTIRITIQSARGTWVRQAIIFLYLAATAFALSHEENDPSGFLYMLIGCMAGVVTLVRGFATSPKQPDMRPTAHGSGLIAMERLRPFSRRRSAAASMLALFTDGMVNGTLPTIAGTLLGLMAGNILAGHCRLGAGLWLLAPYAILTTALATALVSLLLILPGKLAWPLAIAIGGAVAYGPALASFVWGEGSLPFVVLGITLLTAGLVPYAWRRLAEAELPASVPS